MAGKRAQQPLAQSAGGVPAPDPAAPAPDPQGDGLADPALATGLFKYVSPSLQALTGGTMDAPVPEAPAANPVRQDAEARAAAPDAPVLDVVRGKTRLTRHRNMTFVSAAPVPE